MTISYGGCPHGSSETFTNSSTFGEGENGYNCNSRRCTDDGFHVSVTNYGPICAIFSPNRGRAKRGELINGPTRTGSNDANWTDGSGRAFAPTVINGYLQTL